jgi:hypothetical protein
MTDVDHIECDTWGHSWYETTNQGRLRPDFGIPIVLRCERSCGSMRLDVLHPMTYELISRRYIKSPAYQKYKKGERPSKAEFRRILLSTRESRRKGETDD